MTFYLKINLKDFELKSGVINLKKSFLFCLYKTTIIEFDYNLHFKIIEKKYSQKHFGSF